MKNLKKLSILFLLICISSLLVFSQDSNNNLPTKGVFWKISGNGLEKPSYLLGTLHRPEAKAILDTIPEILEVLENVDCLVPEIDTKGINKNLSTQQADSAINEKFKPWPSDSTYQNLLSKEQYEKLLDVQLMPKDRIEFYVEHYRPISLLNRLKLYSKHSAFPKKENYPTDSLFMEALIAYDDSVMVLDIYLENIARHKYKKETIPLETPEEQVNAIIFGTFKFLRNFSYKDEIDLLMDYVENHAKIDSIGKARMDLFISHYLNQNLENMDIALYASDSPYILPENKQEFVSLIIDTRNSLWMEKIPDLIQTKSCFIAVGVGHLKNENGLINQLRKLGYSVERIE